MASAREIVAIAVCDFGALGTCVHARSLLGVDCNWAPLVHRQCFEHNQVACTTRCSSFGLFVCCAVHSCL